MKLLLQLIFLIKVITSLSIENPVVCINDGCVRGITRPGYQSDYFEAFLGIPFAEPPIGNLRFANPVSIKPWNSTINATEEKIFCIQKNYLVPNATVMGEEDCLYLNVYRPKFSRQSIELLPVMFYIYGGGFFSGAAGPSFHGPEYFMDAGDVIFVTVSYRLGALGFLSSGDQIIPGNFGFKDQNLGLKWVQKNIKSFGGDPNLVTLFGQSAGAASVHFHMMSPLSKNLFHRAILISGSGIAPYIKPVENPLLQTKNQAKYAGIKNVDNLNTTQILNELRKIDAKILLDSADNFKVWSVDPLVTFRVAVENSNDPKAFITKSPKEMAQKGEYNFVPLMLSLAENEGAVRAAAIVANKTLLADLNANFDRVLSELFEFNAKSDAELKFKTNKMIDFYLNGTKKIDETNQHVFVKMFGDRAFYHPYYRTYTQYIKYADPNEHPTNLIRFAFKGPLSYSTLLTGSTIDFGVIHCDDLIYLFRSPVLFEMAFEKDSVEAKMIYNMVKTYIHFAITGEPLKWAPVRQCVSPPTDETILCDYQDITKNEEDNDIKVTARNDYDMDVIRLWDDLDL